MFKSMKRNTAASDSFLKEEELPESMSDVLASPDLRVLLLDFLERRLANENLLFYESIENYEKLTTPELRNKTGIKMIAEFVKEDSIYWVNISSAQRKELLGAVDFTPESFSVAKREVYNLLSSNFFDSFRRSLAGAENDAPKLSSDLAFPDFTKSLTFEQLAEALGENMKTSEGASLTGRGSQIEMLRRKSSTGIPSVIRRRLAKPQEGEAETPTRRKALNLLNMFHKQRGDRRSFKLFKEVESDNI